ncbi:hypothetical protein F5887DRAFT_1164312 [Amanita rubescens]|nr:hypothetical protein F5887DRAFT_1164312 [Amanita rubescens]
MPADRRFLALGMGWYAPATGNWCWIEPKPVYLRYLLLHGWRFLFIIIEISLYIYLNIYLRRHYRALVAQGISPPGGIGSRSTHTEPRQESSSRVTIGPGEKSTSEATASVYSPNPSQRSTIGLLPQSRPRSTFWSRLTGLRGTSRTMSDFPADAGYKVIQRALLLNAYPLAYIILWIPGIVNRLIEATGRECTVTQFLQATAQLVGLANALTYGWNEKVANQLRKRFLKR